MRQCARLAALATALIVGVCNPMHAAPLAVPRDRLDSALVMEGARAETYKTVGSTKLRAYIFEPAHGPKSNRAAIVFFFGGGWANGSPRQFEEHCRHFAQRGMLAIAADYRVKTRHNVKPNSCVADAKSCIRWVRENALRLGIDQSRIAAAGGSAGGHLAAACATLPRFDEPGESKSISSVPNALVLFNPVLTLARIEGIPAEGLLGRVTEERMGASVVELSPTHHVRSGLPPTIILHGESDETVPFPSVKAFEQRMKEAGNRCDLVGYAGQGHGFFNRNRSGGKYHRMTLEAADTFLVSLGYLSPPSKAPKPNQP